MITALLLTQFIGVPCAFLFGTLGGAHRREARGVRRARRSTCVITRPRLLHEHRRALLRARAFSSAMVQGGTQALSRSLFASMIPRHKSSEFFAFFGVFERYAGVLGPAIFAFVIERSGLGP